MTYMEEISSIMKEYYKKKEKINVSSSEDIVLIRWKQQELQELNDNTKKELDNIKSNLKINLSNYNNTLNLMYKRIAETTDVGSVQVLIGTVEEIKIKIDEIKIDIQTIEDYILNELSEKINIEIDTRTSEVDLVDEREKLSENAKVLEEASNQATDLEKELPFSDRDSVLSDSFLNITEDVQSLSINDTGTEISKATIDSIKLLDGKYVNNSDFERALLTYIETHKDRKLKVINTLEYTLDEGMLDKCWQAFSNYAVVFIDENHNAYEVTNDFKEFIGSAPSNIKPGNYIPAQSALFGIDKIIKEQKQDTDENTGGTAYVKK